MTEINQIFPTWTTDKLFLTLSLKPSWRYYEFEKEFGLSVNDLTDFCDLFCTCDHRVHVYADATKSDLEHFANFLNEQEATSQIKTDSFCDLFTDFMEEKGLSRLAIDFENLEAEGYFEYLAEQVFIRDRTSQEQFWEEYEETTYEIEEWGDLFRKVIDQKDDNLFKINFRLEGEDRFNETYSLIACDENNEELGILSFTLDLAEKKSVIEAFRVEEPHRNKGIGTLLLKSYANLGYSYTYPSQICFKSNNNQEVIRLFNKFDFSTVPYTDPHYPDFIKMVKIN